MIVCPSCNSPEGVQIEASRSGPDQWSSRCEPCGHTWTFNDDI
jgi:predicted Zn finger-like uncharacterized protein